MSTTDTLARIEARLNALEATVAQAGADCLRAYGLTAQVLDLQLARVPVADLRESMLDVFKTLGLVGQLNEVYHSQREQLAILAGLAAQLLIESRTAALARTAASALTDTQALTHAQAVTINNQEIVALLRQLVVEGSAHVAGLRALERALDGQATGQDGA